VGQNLRGERKNFRLNIEYVSANPTGYLHLAHFRHAVVGADHHGTTARLKSAYQLLGHNPEYLQIILVQTVNLLTKDGPTRFSKRAGNTIELAEALKYLQLDQLKFFLCEKDPNQPLSINTELLKENQEKTRLYYIQYAHARCHQIFQKAQQKNIDRIGSSIDLLTDQAER
ncbi:24972_t:CDS:2, partial [Racocetra persica]